MNKFFKIVASILLSCVGTGILHAEVTGISAGGDQSLALVAGGDVFQWGEFAGSLPVPVFGLDRVKSLASGAHHSLALRSDGTVWAWGSNSAGQLGDGTVIKADHPKAVMDITGASAIAAAGDRSYALKNDGTVWAWGANAKGLLGDGTTHDRRGPVVMEGLIDVTAIAAGESVFVALRKDGSVCTLGLASKDPGPDCSSPFHSVSAVAAEATGVYLLLRDGSVHALGPRSCGADIQSVDIILQDVHAIAAGPTHLILLKDDRTVWTCGRNASGQLGEATTDSRDRPIQVSGALTNPTLIAAGRAHSLAVTDSGIWSWGDNSSGQLGTGNTSSRLLPGPIWDGTGRLR